MTEGDKDRGKAGEGGKAAVLINTIKDINLSLKDIHTKIASVSSTNNEILENVGKRFEELLGMLLKEKEGNEKSASEIGNLKENFRGYDGILNKFLTDVTSKVEEGVDKSYDVVNGCVTVVEALKGDFENLGNELVRLNEHIPALYREMEALSLSMKGAAKAIHEDRERYLKVLEESRTALEGMNNSASELERIVKEQWDNCKAVVSAADKLTNYAKDLSDSGNQVIDIHKALADNIKNKYAEEANERKGSRKSIARWIKGGVAGVSAGLLLLMGAYGLKGCEAEKTSCSDRENERICYRMADKGIVYIRDSNKDGLADEILVKTEKEDIYRMERNSDGGKRNYKLFEKADGILKEKGKK